MNRGLSRQAWDKLSILRSKETWPSHEFIEAFMAAHSGGPPRDERTGSAVSIHDGEGA